MKTDLKIEKFKSQIPLTASGNYKVNSDKLKHLNLTGQVLMYITDSFARRKPIQLRAIPESLSMNNDDS